MPHYIPRLIASTECLGNSLSTINLGFSALDTNLQALSVYTVNSVNFLSSSMISVSSTLQTEINFLSATMQSVSANLQTEINFLSAASRSYHTQGTIYQQSNGVITWDVSLAGHNAKVILSANGVLNNILNVSAGEIGNLVLQVSGIGAPSLTGWGSNFIFSNGLSSMSTGVDAYNLLTFYFDGLKYLSTLSKF
jgi:hypothetical protein